MRKTSDQQFREADAAIERTVADFITAIERMTGRWDAVARDYIIERLLLELCEKLTRLTIPIASWASAD